jgi:hypothetical protein
MKVLGDYGSWWVWPLLALYAVGAVIGLIGMARTYWAGTAPHYGFYGDDPYIHEAAHVGPWPLYSFALLFLLSCLLLISARHAAATKNSAKAKT